ncbi:DegT/DnrJ/EryC1/StrS family aminotransferase [Exiguobacterium sp. AM39-5BH]|uniref:DegT/DnrJ/EryC1/StrS family aminotransferase n=1 Tax=Exiguobacterium sp. AM39-5BH TaxID=2292355 RepID=UPI000FE2419D|nr:DegT/DnrJ/EryC1/StrS family aminotransferase [Exiguobacterium sp. AM39-5BH]RHB49233.1 hypothetical protein DW881_08330 [Exiguobacterium sp. AM39-5BH]
MEIGSEFWLTEQSHLKANQESERTLKFKNISFTSSGRGAISLVLQQIKPIAYTVLLPKYICSSMILPFTESGYQCIFYDLDEKLNPVLETLEVEQKVGVFLHLGYFGFNTNNNLREYITKLNEANTIVIEDITHTLFSNFTRHSKNDYYVASIRKWMGIATGGFAASNTHFLLQPIDEQINFLELRLKGLSLKKMYIESQNETLKNSFLNSFNQAELLLDEQSSPYAMDEASQLFYDNLDVEDLVNKRRENYQVLEEGLKNVSFVESLFGDLEGRECPFFYPILIKEVRNEVKKALIDEKIYCPVHWPIPKVLIENQIIDRKNSIYNEILSIPCDQRYGEQEMSHVVRVIKKISNRFT